MKNLSTSVKNLVNLIPNFNVVRISILEISDSKCFIQCFGSQFFGQNKYSITTNTIKKETAEAFVNRFAKVLGFDVDRDY